MKALAVYPGKPDSLHLREVPVPELHEVPGGRGVLVRVLRVGVDGTDREINEALYGAAPPGDDFLIIGPRVARRGRGGGPVGPRAGAG